MPVKTKKTAPAKAATKTVKPKPITKEKQVAASDLTAKKFIEKLKTYQSAEELKKMHRFFTFTEDPSGKTETFMGVRMGQIFELAKAFVDMPLKEIEKLLESNFYEIRTGACSIMRQQAVNKKTPESRRKELHDLYLRRHDRINDWGLVDLASYKVVGSYLYDFDKPRKVLYKLARSKNTWERRTAITAPLYFILKKEIDDALAIAEILINDKEDLVNKATGWALRECYKVDRQRLLAFLDKHAATMPRVTLRYTIEHLSPALKKHYMDLKVKVAAKK
jgi:3-methyladenine DNA glycosylase AlkD